MSLHYGPIYPLDRLFGSIGRLRLDREAILIGEEIGNLLDRERRSMEWEIRVLERGTIRVLDRGEIRVLERGEIRVLEWGEIGVLEELVSGEGSQVLVVEVVKVLRQ